ncbi:GNAT family acetyltransferase [Stutzerimonas nosocomialis]|uniref:GNAT family acetyltransferase n=1 Tax=Stutzerimonas nosocomialis TaxID=1056496 RepID=A0A5R9Q8P2_9GAMM|nr:GNAT family acetyltransferase [Stutzerimonas nosocomialis]TLX56014.1 GNAT family acetyltransferase [Stutzerimonas nosocomialis]TLX61527.1 GNAT family acetyltransferase [Stutzerimonas nosocomialis]
MNIRPYHPADEDAVVQLWEDCGLTRPWNDPHKDIARKLTQQPELFLVGEVAGELMASAMAGYDGHRGSVHYLAVAPAYQAQGHGRQMLEAVEQRLFALGCPKLNLLVRTSNERTLAFYRSLGYGTDDVFSLGKRLIPDLPG